MINVFQPSLGDAELDRAASSGTRPAVGAAPVSRSTSSRQRHRSATPMGGDGQRGRASDVVQERHRRPCVGVGVGRKLAVRPGDGVHALGP